MINLAITLPRSDVNALHEWLDTFAPGWKYQNKRADIRKQNEVFCDLSIAAGTGHKKAVIFIKVKQPEHHMAAKLAWPIVEVYPPLVDAKDK